MNRQEAFEIVVEAVARSTIEKPKNLEESTDLIKSGIIDSLDSVTMLFQMEEIVGKPLNISDEFEDFRISNLIDLILAA